MLYIKNLSVSIMGSEVISNLSFLLTPGSVHALMGPNGSGKSSLALALMGHPFYTVTAGEILLNNQDITSCSPDKRAQKGLFLAFQYPPAIPGVTVGMFLREACKAIGQKDESIELFNLRLKTIFQMLCLDELFAERSLHDGFSGGERKKIEIAQLLLLKPSVAILDEIDSGLDIDALKVVAKGINEAKKQNPNLCLLIITHYQRILEYITPDYVHIMKPGHCGGIAKSGGYELVHVLEQKGYDGILI